MIDDKNKTNPKSTSIGKRKKWSGDTHIPLDVLCVENEDSFILGSSTDRRKSGSMDQLMKSEVSPASSIESFMSGQTDEIDFKSLETGSTKIQIDLKYDPQKWLLMVCIKQAECPFSSSKMFWQVHFTLLPHCDRRYKTKYKNTSTPIFNQVFDVEDVAKNSLSQMALRCRLYGRYKKVGRKRLLGETEVDLSVLLCKEMGLSVVGEWHNMTKQFTVW